MVIITSVICSICVFLVFVLLIEYACHNQSTIRQRMKYYTEVKHAPDDPNSPVRKKQMGKKAMGFVKETAKIMNKLQRWEKLDLKMRQAGLPLLGSEYIVIAFLGAAITGVAVFLLTINPQMAIVVTVTVLLGEWFYISYRIGKRRKDFISQLGDCLVTVSNALRAGFSFLQAIELVSKEMEPPISEEFAMAIRDMKIDSHMEKALEDMDARVACPEFSLVVTAVIIQHQVGGNLAQILDNISGTIHERIRMKHEVMALTAQGRASGWVLALLPVVLAVLLSAMSPTYLEPLWTSNIGRMAIGAAIILEFIGFFVIQRIVEVDI